MTAFASALAAQSANAAAQADSTLKLLRDRSLTTAASRDQELAQRLTTISDNPKAALKDLQAQQATLQQGLAQLQEDMAKFLKPSAPPGRPAPTPPVPQPAVGPARPPPGPRTPLRAASAKPPAPRRARTTKKKTTKK